VSVRTGSFLDQLDPAIGKALVDGATGRAVPAGELIVPPSRLWTRVGVITDGVARGILGSADGRQLTVRYVRPGDLVGSIYPLAGDRAPLAIQAITECRFLEIEPERFQALLRESPALSEAVISFLYRRLEDLYATLAASTFGTLRERLAAHLLELARPDEAGVLVVRVSQQDLADSVGTVREVVTRTLRDLRLAGMITTSPGVVTIQDPVGLAAAVGRWTVPHGTGG
jgi:CRP/FNR family cyclic AMP-dependent transcriptional regulator